MTTALPPDEFFAFLVREGLLDETTIPSGTDRMAFVQARVDAGLLRQEDLDAAKARFVAQRHAAPSLSRSDTPDPLVGHILGGCRIDALLGQGGMGSVYLATQLSLERLVAVKVQNEVAIPELVERFRTEAKTLGRLHSAHIVDVYEVGTENGVPWFVMEFMPGGSLTSYVRKLPGGLLPRAEARRLLLESAQGLAEAERHGVLHRDIKPDNLLLDSNGTLKIADFGIAKTLHEDPGLTATGFSPGTPAFKSPEQVAASPLDFRTDMYSLGLSFWSLVAGQRPRDAIKRQEALLAASPHALPWSSPELAEVGGDALLTAICRMMALKREDRFASWQELIDELRALPADGTASVRPPVRRAAVKVLAVAVLLAAGVGALVWSRPAQHGDRPQVPERTENRVAEADLAMSPAPSKAASDAAASPPADRRDTAPPQEPEPRPAPQGQPADPKPAGDHDAEARRQLLLELEQPLPNNPRSADDVRTAIGNLTARATSLALLADARYVEARTRLDREVLAAQARDGLRAQRTLAKFGELAALRARAEAIALPNYRDDARAWLDELERTRPRFLRVSAADHEWLSGWATWNLEDDETAERGGRFLPARLVDARRGASCAMVLLWSEALLPAYVDATEVTLGQWTLTQALPAGLEGPSSAELPVRNVEPAAIDAFLAAWSLRLPTLAEFTFALETRPGDRSWWGNTLEPPRDHARLNIADQALRHQNALAPYLPGYEDGVPGVATATDLRFAQGRGLAFHHLLGNVAEWVTEGASSVVLGGSYMTSSWETFECRYRQPVLGGKKRQDLGFRAARSVPAGN